MKIEYCRYILDVAETLSIRQSAEKLFITQQGLSQAIQTVEKELGIEIFSRSGNRIHVTAAGQVVLERFRAMVNDYQLLLMDVSEYERMASGDKRSAMTIYYTSTVGAMYISSVLAKLLKRYPRLQLRMYDIEVRGIAGMSIDANTIIICGMPLEFINAFEASGQNDKLYHDMASSPLMCNLSITSPYANKKVITIEDLKTMPIAVFDDEKNMIEQLLGSCDDVNITFSGNNYSLFRDVISMMPVMGFTTTLNEHYFRRGNTIQVPLDADIEIRYGCFTATGEISPLVEECLDIVKAELNRFNDERECD